MATKLNDIATTVRLVPLAGTFQAVSDFAEKFSAKSGEEVPIGTLAADLDAQRVRVETVEVGSPDLIVSGHAGTREVLAERFPTATVIEGNVALDDIAGQVVAGTLPPHLVSEAAGYISATIREFDYSRDGDLAGEELHQRLIVGDAVKVTVS